MAGNDRTTSGDVVSRHSMWVLAPVKELRDGRVGLGTARNLLRMSMGNNVLVNRERGDIVGELVVSGLRSRSGGLAGSGHIDSAGDFLHVFRRACVVEVVLAIVLHVFFILVLCGRYNNLNFAAEY